MTYQEQRGKRFAWKIYEKHDYVFFNEETMLTILDRLHERYEIVTDYQSPENQPPEKQVRVVVFIDTEEHKYYKQVFTSLKPYQWNREGVFGWWCPRVYPRLDWAFDAEKCNFNVLCTVLNYSLQKRD